MKNRPVLVFAGAVLAVVLVVACSPGAGEPPAAQDSDSTTSLDGDPATTAAATEDPSTTLAAQAPLGDLDDYPVDEDFPVQLAPGTYVVTRVEPFEIMITVPAGWQRARVPSMVWGQANTNLGFGTVDNVYADPCAEDLLGLDPPVGPTVDDLVAALAALPGMETTAPQDVTVDGFAGQYIELHATSEAGQCDPALWRIDPALSTNPSIDESVEASTDEEYPNKMWIVDVDGERLVITSDDREEATPAEYAERDQIVESIQIDVP